MGSVLIANAKAIVTVDEADRILEGHHLLIEDGIITYIGTEKRPADRVIDAAGCFVYPGLVNTHHHLCDLRFNLRVGVGLEDGQGDEARARLI